MAIWSLAAWASKQNVSAKKKILKENKHHISSSSKKTQSTRSRHAFYLRSREHTIPKKRSPKIARYFFHVPIVVVKKIGLTVAWRFRHTTSWIEGRQPKWDDSGFFSSEKKPRWWFFKCFFFKIFHHWLREMIQFDEHIFQMGTNQKQV